MPEPQRSHWDLGTLVVTGIGSRKERNCLRAYGYSHARALCLVSVVMLTIQGRNWSEPFHGWSPRALSSGSNQCYDDSSRVDVETSGLKARHRK